MKKWFLKLLVVVLVAALGTAAVAQEADAAKVGLRLWLVFDTSSNCRGQWAELQSIARAAVQALEPGDRVRVEAATTAEPRLVALEQLPVGDAVRKEILRAITELRSEDDTETVAVPRRSFVNKLLGQEGPTEYESRPRNVQADFVKGLAVPLSVVKSEQSQERGRDLVILLTCARWSDEQTQQCLSIHEEFKAHNVTLVITGASNANRSLVLAATRGLLNWHEIVYCDPAAWIAEARKRANPSPTSTPKPEKPETQGAGTIPLRGDAGKAMIAVPPPSSPPARETSKTAPVPAASEGSSSKPGKVLELSISLTRPGEQTVEFPVSVPTTPAALQPSPGTATSRPNVDVSVPPAQSPPVLPLTTLPAEPGPAAVAPEAPATPHATPIPGIRLGWRRYWFVWAPAGLLLFVIGGLVVRDLSRAGREARPTAASQALNEKPNELIVHVNGGERSMGNTQSLMQFNIGSAVGNSLRIQEQGVEEQHLRVKRTRGGDWTVMNLSRKPVEINGMDVDGGTTTVLEFPASVRISDSASFSLFLRPLPVC